MRILVLGAGYALLAVAAAGAFVASAPGAAAASALLRMRAAQGISAPPAPDSEALRPRPDLHPGPDAAGPHGSVRAALTIAAEKQGLDPGLVLAVAWWESGWDQTKVSETGARGVMQVDPQTAAELGPRLLHRPADPADLQDNADLGAAVLRSDLQDAGGNLDVALASYYEGAGNVDPSNLDPGAQTYVTGVKILAARFDAGWDPS